jgi:hypothetical protein
MFESLKLKGNLSDGFSFGPSAFGACVTVTMVETSNVGVKVGMVGRGVIDAVGVADGSGDGVDVLETESDVGCDGGVACPQAVRNKVALSSPIVIRFIIILPELGLLLKRKLVYWSSSFP